jgi:UDP-N-acetylmuramoyl-tripeptide--D-alanyl-D-alanine ligase
MNHPGEIALLASMAQPTVALVNKAQREHQEFMATVEAVAQENGAVLAALPANGVAVFPTQDTFTPLWQQLAAGRTQVGFAISHVRSEDGLADQALSADVWGQCQWQGAKWRVQASSGAYKLNFDLQVAGQHNVTNALAAAACALAAGVSPASVEAGLSAFEPVKGRSRALTLQCQGRALTVVDDTYNANPDSVRAAIDVLAELPAPRLLVLGDMGEVGVNGAAFHAEVGQHAQAQGIERLFTLGDLAQASASAHAAATHFGDMAALQAAVLAQAAKGGSVLVKGSRFMRMERVVQAMLEHSPAQEAACS